MTVRHAILTTTVVGLAAIAPVYGRRRGSIRALLRRRASGPTRRPMAGVALELRVSTGMGNVRAFE